MFSDDGLQPCCQLANPQSPTSPTNPLDTMAPNSLTHNPRLVDMSY